MSQELEQACHSNTTDGARNELGVALERQMPDAFAEAILRHARQDSIAVARSMLLSEGNKLVDPADFLFMHTFKGERYFFFRSRRQSVIALRETMGTVVYAANGREVFEQIAQTYRPDEGVLLWEEFRPSNIAIALATTGRVSLAGGGYYLTELLGEGFESVALRATDVHGQGLVVKVGKIDLAQNYQTMRPLLVEMRAQGLVTPSYLNYDPAENAILMEDAGPQTLEFKMKTEKNSTAVLRSILQAIKTLKSLENRLGLHHGDPAAANLIVQHSNIAMIDFRFSPTIAFDSEIYRRRDVFTMMYTLYQFLYGKQALCILETKNSIHRLETPAQPDPEHLPIIYPAVQRYHALGEFLQRNLYRPEGVDLSMLEELVSQVIEETDK